jgi:hypothetical protein
VLQVLTEQMDGQPQGASPSDLVASIARCLAELIMHYVASATTYAVTQQERDAAGAHDLTAAVDTVLQTAVLPLLPRLTAAHDPMPLFAQKILAMVLHRRASLLRLHT